MQESRQPFGRTIAVRNRAFKDFSRARRAEPREVIADEIAPRRPQQLRPHRPLVAGMQFLLATRAVVDERAADPRLRRRQALPTAIAVLAPRVRGRQRFLALAVDHSSRKSTRY